MRKSLVTLLALLLCAVVLLVAAVAAVGEGRTDISVTEHTLTGDPETVRGLVVETFLNLNRQLFWHTTCIPGAEPEVSTEFTYTLTSRSTQSESRYFADLSVGCGGWGVSGSGITPESFTDVEMAEPAWDVASRTGAGETRTEIVQLNRYYDTFSVTLEGSGVDMLTDAQRKEWTSFLTDYFRIPIPDCVLWEVTVEKDLQGEITTINCSESMTDGKESAYGWADCVYLGTDLYLLFRGNLDMSQITGGYGIYRIPGEVVSEYQGVAIEPRLVLKVRELENIYPLDAQLCGQVSLVEGTDNTLLLMRQQENQVRVRVIDPVTCEARQELLLEGGELPEVWSCGALTAFVQNRETIQAYVREDGLLTRWMAAELYPLNDNSSYYDAVLAFDGERLAIAASRTNYNVASNRILIYDETGLRYAGDYSYSCDEIGMTRLETYNWVEPLQIHWTESE